MGITVAILPLESALDQLALDWVSLADHDYKAIVRSWADAFLARIAQGQHLASGHRARAEFMSRLPADTLLLSGVHIPRLSNQGGRGAACYRATQLSSLDLALASSLELIALADDLSWCFPLSHETGAFAAEEFYVV